MNHQSTNTNSSSDGGQNITPSQASSNLPIVETPDEPTSEDAPTQSTENTGSPEVGESGAPQDLVNWGLQKFADQPIIMTSSFGMEGCALMDMCSKAIEEYQLPKLQIACIDTGFFFPETKQLRQKLIDRYSNLEFLTWETSVSIEQQRELYGDMLWKNNPNMCCNIRKVKPMRENIVNYRLWITALRRTQTKERSGISVLAWDWRYELMKFCPLATWTRAQVWKYIQENEVPFNQLHLQNYPSVSCFHCTRAVPGSNPQSEIRKGRWAETDKDECGLHFSI